MLLHTLSSHALSLVVLLSALSTAVVPEPSAGSGGDPDETPLAPKPAKSFSAVGKEFLATLTPAQQEQPFTDLEEDDDAPPAGGIDDDLDAAPEGAQPETIQREDGAHWNAEAGRWQNASGHFVAGDLPEGVPAPAKPAAAAPSGDDATWTKLALPGLADRGEQDLEIEIDDPQIIERINRLKSEAGRSRTLQRRANDVEAQAAELAELDQFLTTDPVGFVVGRMKPELRRDVARALLLEHYDELADDIAAFQADPAQRHQQRVALRDSMTDSRDRMQQATAMRQHAVSCVRAAEAMVPEGTDDQTTQEFLGDARALLAQYAQSGQRVTPETVPQLLARRAALYGFSKDRGTGPAAPAAGAPPVAPAARSAPAPAAAASIARPVTDRARDVAARQPTKAEASAAQARIRQVQTQRTAAGKVAPAGAGAAPVQMPVLPPEAKSDVRSASKYLRQSGKLSESWAPST